MEEVGREQRNLAADEWRAVLPEAQREAKARGIEIPQADVVAPKVEPAPAKAEPAKVPAAKAEAAKPAAPKPVATPRTPSAPAAPLSLPDPISTPLREADGTADETPPAATDQ